MSAADKSLEMPKASVRRIMKLNEEVPNISAVSYQLRSSSIPLFFCHGLGPAVLVLSAWSLHFFLVRGSPELNLY